MAPIAQSAEAADLKSAKCEFESHWGHHIGAGQEVAAPVECGRSVPTLHELSFNPNALRVELKLAATEVALVGLAHGEYSQSAASARPRIADDLKLLKKLSRS
jgi:hypothetical protein